MLLTLSCVAAAVVVVSMGPKSLLPIMAGAAFGSMLTLHIQNLV